ncbi:hypothetical protein CAPTEDRAFT_144305, partial [Capitella teleta]
NGRWSAWTDWTGCNATCDEGSQQRFRFCEPPKYGGKDCMGESYEWHHIRRCEIISCHNDGYWSTWGSWSLCSATCSGGTWYRTRDCLERRGNGARCEGDRGELAQCEMESCPRSK